MKAVLYTKFGETPVFTDLRIPDLHTDGVIIEVKATGICRSDWHGWMGHDKDIRLPHVPGHELAGIIVKKGSEVSGKWNIGDRVTLPFSCGCGRCFQCGLGNEHICDYYFQPGFTDWGSFAEYVQIRFADVNLVELPENMSFTDAAILGCRFATAYRALKYQGKIQPGQWISVFGCGGVGISAIAIAKAIGAKVIAIDKEQKALLKAREIGADQCLLSGNAESIPQKIIMITHGGTDIAIDAIGHPEIIKESLYSLKKRGKHIQVGLMSAHGHTADVDMDLIIGRELELIGSHGLQSHCYTEMFELIEREAIDLQAFISEKISLSESIKVLTQMDANPKTGVSIITDFKH